MGEEDIFNFFDLTLSNSKHLVNRLREKGIKSDFLGHSFDPIILDKINIPSKKINRVSFFGNLDLISRDFNERTRLLEKVSNDTGKLDVYGKYSIFSKQKRFKYKLLETRLNLSRFANKMLPIRKLNIGKPFKFTSTPASTFKQV